MIVIDNERSLVGLSRADALRALGETVHFLEPFTPCSQQEYEAQIYKHRGHFIR